VLSKSQVFQLAQTLGCKYSHHLGAHIMAAGADVPDLYTMRLTSVPVVMCTQSPDVPMIVYAKPPAELMTLLGVEPAEPSITAFDMALLEMDVVRPHVVGTHLPQTIAAMLATKMRTTPIKRAFYTHGSVRQERLLDPGVVKTALPWTTRPRFRLWTTHLLRLAMAMKPIGLHLGGVVDGAGNETRYFDDLPVTHPLPDDFPPWDTDVVMREVLSLVHSFYTKRARWNLFAGNRNLVCYISNSTSAIWYDITLSDDPVQTSLLMHPTPVSKIRCDACGRVPQHGDKLLLRCMGCRHTYYCHHTCQRAGWKTGHRTKCLGL
jgi:hypothetical protein